MRTEFGLNLKFLFGKNLETLLIAGQGYDKGSLWCLSGQFALEIGVVLHDRWHNVDTEMSASIQTYDIRLHFGCCNHFHG